MQQEYFILERMDHVVGIFYSTKEIIHVAGVFYSTKEERV